MKAPVPIVVVGSANTDMILQLARIPRPGETLLGGRFSLAAGGKGANQAVAAARAGGDVKFIAKVGADMFGAQAIEGLGAAGVDTRHVTQHATEASGVALIFVADDGEDSIGVGSGANAHLTPADIDAARTVIAAARILLVQLESPLETVAHAVNLATSYGASVILNPAPAQALPAELLRNVTLLTPNETEAELLTGVPVTDEQGAAQAADALRSRGVRSVVVTLGKRGSYIASDEGCGLVAPFRVQPIDTTAAGDVFNGALAVALAAGESIFSAVRFANAAGALSTTKLGAQPSAPHRAEIDRLVAAQ